MARRAYRVIAVVAFMGAGILLASPTFAAPAQPVDIARGADSEIESVSFWAMPYPYGYTYRGHSCVRHVRVQTKSGIRWRRVWVCR